MGEVLALEFEAPTGETLRFEWDAGALAALGPELGGEPVWRLAGELDWDEVELVRVLSARLGDGRLLAIVALRPAAAAGHGEELVAAALGDETSFERLGEALLSTEYGPDGLPRRIGLELYPTEDGFADRIAADVSAAATSEAGGVRRTSAALSLRGEDGGAATYDVLERA